MAKTTDTETRPPSAIDADVTIDYEQMLAAARSYVQSFKNAQALEKTILTLTKREQIVKELVARRVAAEQELKDVESKVESVREALESEAAELNDKNKELRAEASRLERQVHNTRQQLESAQMQLGALQEQHRQEMVRMEVERKEKLQVADRDIAELHRQRKEELRRMEQDHMGRLEALQGQAEKEAERAKNYKAEIDALKAKLGGV